MTHCMVKKVVLIFFQMIEFREAVFNSLLNMLRVSLEAGLHGDDKNLESASESNVAKLSEGATLPDSNMLNLVPDFKGKEEVNNGELCTWFDNLEFIFFLCRITISKNRKFSQKSRNFSDFFVGRIKSRLVPGI